MPEREKQSLCCLLVLTFIGPLWIYFACLMDCSNSSLLVCSSNSVLTRQ